MAARPPADIGIAVDDVDTPALLVDLDALERNLARMADAAKAGGVALRPHAKTHKDPVIAHMQIARGAVGVCCQKVAEAEVMVNGGVGDVLVANEIVGAQKLRRLAALARRATISVCVDDPSQVAALEEAAAEAKAPLGVLVEINVGGNRAGVGPGEPAVALARRVAAASSLRFRGLQAYYGAAQHMREDGERRAAIASAVAAVGETRALLKRGGLPCDVITGGGTGTYPLEANSGIYTEIQPGSYVFMDVDYARNRRADGSSFADFEQSLFVLTTVMSRVSPERAMVDAGLKALGTDSGMPVVDGRPDLTYARAADEHGRLELAADARPLRLGDKLRLVPGHCDPTVNLHDWYVGIRNGVVEAVWPVAARGAIH